MGFSFYVCNKCGQINSESDMGAHENKCERPKKSKKYINKLKEDIENEFGDHCISMWIFTFFDTFWKAVDFWVDNRGTNSEEMDNSLKTIKTLLYSGNYTNYPKIKLKQSKKDYESTKKAYMKPWNDNIEWEPYVSESVCKKKSN